MKPIFALFALLATSVVLADKPTLAIPPVNVSPVLTESQMNDVQRRAMQQVILSLQPQLINSFGQTGKFTVISRTDLPQILQEQTLGQSGNINPSNAAKQGDISGASYVLVVGIDFFNIYQESANFQSISRDITRDIVEINTVSRLYDASTGALLTSSSNTVRDDDFVQYFAFAQKKGDLQNTVYQEATRVLAQNIAASLTNSLFPAKVVAKTGKQITINQGSANGFNPNGDRMNVYAVGEEMTDPDTGESLGLEEVFLSRATILRQDERTTIAILEEDNGVERGHIVRVE